MLKLNEYSCCDCCGAPPIMGFNFCEKHIRSTLARYNEPMYEKTTRMMPINFEIFAHDTTEGKLQRLAFRCICSIAGYSGRDAANYLSGLLSNPTQYTRSR